MTEKIKYYQAIITDYTKDTNGTVTVYFFTELAIGTAHIHSLTFPNYIENEKAGEFFGNLPIFTQDEKIDFDSLQGIHVSLKFVDRGNRWELEDAEIDSLYYAIHSEEEQEWY